MAQQPDRYLSPFSSVAKGKAPGMQSRLLGAHNGVREYVLIFTKGDEVLSGISDFASANDIVSARFTAVGALKNATTAWFDLQKKSYRLNVIDQQVELVSLIGDIALYDGRPAIHAHYSVGLSDGNVQGGHLIHAVTYPTVEVFLTAFPQALHKKLDKETDLKLIHPEILSNSNAMNKEFSQQANGPRGIDHVGITVPDLGAACTFLEKALGATSVYDVLPRTDPPFEGVQTEKELGIPHNSKIIHMRLMRLGNGPTLEVFQFADAPQNRSAGLNDYGYTHIAVYVDDIHAAVKRFADAGGTMLSAPHDLYGSENGPNNSGAYGRAPWGSLIEFITYPDGIKYPDPERTRWTPAR